MQIKTGLKFCCCCFLPTAFKLPQQWMRWCSVRLKQEESFSRIVLDGFTNVCFSIGESQFFSIKIFVLFKKSAALLPSGSLSLIYTPRKLFQRAFLSAKWQLVLVATATACK